MISFPDTSFLCAFYRRQDNSPQAAAYFKTMPEALHVSGLLLYQFRQSVRFQVWLHARDKGKGYSRTDCDRALADLKTDLDTGALMVVIAGWPDVHRLAEAISKRHTIAGGHRSLDILHVATALHFGARQFLTFDASQRKLAAAEGLKVKP
ncbi:MAG TPA: type II toxin-antitoxin system VapC family toxin [Candidatus Saccharimonadales bacterium]|nr:type II toxin-antitoxin system VapC family toxin [Candidatus Saccharimonadales bacterium]